MATLVACVGTGKGTWLEVAAVISAADWESVFVVTNEFGREKFSHEKPLEKVIIDPQQSAHQIMSVVKDSLTGKIQDTEVALHCLSGTGKEHMAVLGALLKLGLGIRLVIAENGELKEL